jgi:hypothetical protein
MKTIAQLINWDSKANGGLEIKNKIGEALYHFYLEADKDTIKDSLKDDIQDMAEYEKKKKRIIFLANAAAKKKHNEIYFEDSDGEIIDKRPKPCEGKIVEIEGIKYKLTKL